MATNKTYQKVGHYGQIYFLRNVYNTVDMTVIQAFLRIDILDDDYSCVDKFLAKFSPSKYAWCKETKSNGTKHVHILFWHSCVRRTVKRYLAETLPDIHSFTKKFGQKRKDVVDTCCYFMKEDPSPTFVGIDPLCIQDAKDKCADYKAAKKRKKMRILDRIILDHNLEANPPSIRKALRYVMADYKERRAPIDKQLLRKQTTMLLCLTNPVYEERILADTEADLLCSLTL